MIAWITVFFAIIKMIKRVHFFLKMNTAFALNHLDSKYSPDGYNLGWNCGDAGGQDVFHAHLHIIPRHADEPYAKRGIRNWIKREENRRPKRT